MRLKPIKPKPPGYRAAQLVLVPLFAGLLAINGLIVSCGPSSSQSQEGPQWNSPTTSTSTETLLTPVKKPAVSSDTAPTAPRTTPATAPWPPKPVAAAALPKASSSSTPAGSSPIPHPAPSTAPSSVDSTSFQGSELQGQRNFSPRSDNSSESIQLTPCQRSAAACFASGGLDTLLDNLDGLAIDPVTGRFCFSFQEGCRR